MQSAGRESRAVAPGVAKLALRTPSAEMAELEIKPSLRARAMVFAVVLIACGIGLTLIYLFLGASGNFFAPTTTLATFMPDATGLDIDSEVRLSGIPIGAITEVSFPASSILSAP